MSKEQYQGLGLSDEELAALEGDDDAPQEAAEGSLDDDDDDLDDDDIESVGNDTVGDDPDADNQPAAEDPPAQEVDQPEFQPAVEPVADYEKVIGELTAKEDELAQQFDEGEITQREYRAQIRELDSQRRALEDQQRDYERSQELAKQKWQWEVDTFMDNVKDTSGIDYRQNKMLNAALDTAVKELANDPANEDKSGKWFLQEAHKKVAELMGKPATTTKDPVKDAVKNRKPDLDKVPQTLADAPRAQVDTDGDEFSKLDKLSGMDLERALSALSPAQAKAYLER